MNDDTLTTYEVLVNQQKQLNKHDKEITFIRICCICMTIILTTLSIALVIIMIKIK